MIPKFLYCKKNSENEYFHDENVLNEFNWISFNDTLLEVKVLFVYYILI